MRFALLTLLTSASPALADGLLLVPPLDCDLNGPCYIQQYVDHDTGPGSTDFTCGALSYDGHKGTDFALPSLAAQAAGVTVLASARGTVRATRDGMADILQGSPDAPDVSNVECGNGVVIDHGDGWETQYCHMAKDSILVQPGQVVAAGDPLGRVGLSGQTQFPHVHLSVRRDGQVVDPFAPNDLNNCDATAGEETLWVSTPPTPAGGIITAGFYNGVPDYDQVKEGAAALTALSPTDPMVVWGYVFGGKPQDVLTLTINGPAGEVFRQDVILERQQAQLFRAGGKRAPASGWSSGSYTGTITLMRDGSILDQQIETLILP